MLFCAYEILLYSINVRTLMASFILTFVNNSLKHWCLLVVIFTIVKSSYILKVFGYTTAQVYYCYSTVNYCLKQLKCVYIYSQFL